MAYTPTVWTKGDKVTSEKLNKLENGVKVNSEDIENNILIVEIAEGGNPDSLVTNKTASEIMNAKFAIFYMLDGDTKYFYPYNYGYDGEIYWVTIMAGEELSLSTEDENELLLYDPNPPAPPIE